ncbi:DUF58 domain-containing protein [Planomicrobium sp. CPCC 101110]|uniref:DUF58 domain-containing protein n=1 Tax=Planomicrobium sp. CPCC 101110 TaxID=2599619 RepID=UPI0011B52F04|nr:DUF58 domain-containing protein [Planomicrobium sp. CPCC 101110]TWT28026.1 DUF58 domain-containing protein [Planomicrobium sp. CPCC 101110]
MGWIRHEYNAKSIKNLFGLLAVFFFLLAAFLQFAAAAVIAFVLIAVGLQLLYFEHVGKKLEFQNTKSRRRTLNGGETFWELIFENRGLPIWGGKLKISFYDAVSPIGEDRSNFTETIEMDVPFTIGLHQNMVVRVPLVGRKRGLSRIHKMELVIPHLFAEGSATLEYRPMVLQELLVYPKLGDFSLQNIPVRQKPGEFNMKHSLFDDVFQPIGTRDYVPADQFNQIHWKASVRAQTLQTKVYAKVTNESMLFVLDAASGYATIHNLEERIEELAAYIENCYAENIPYAIAINMRSAGKFPYYYLAADAGPTQRQRALELLSIISKNHSTIPLQSMLAHLDVHIDLPFSTYLLTDKLAEASRFIAKWNARTNLRVLESRKGGETA